MVSSTSGAGAATGGAATGVGAFSFSTGTATGANPGGGAIPGGGAGTDFVLVEVDSEIGFFLGEACVLGGFVLCVDSDDFPRAIAVDNEIAFFFSLSLSVRADPMGKTDGEGGGNALLLPFDLRETRLPILSVLGVGEALLRGTVLTEIFLPQPAEFGSADAIRQFQVPSSMTLTHTLVLLLLVLANAI
jgi:hypothetical protein